MNFGRLGYAIVCVFPLLVLSIAWWRFADVALRYRHPGEAALRH